MAFFLSLSRKPNKTGAESSALLKGLATSLADRRRAAAPFALLLTAGLLLSPALRAQSPAGSNMPPALQPPPGQTLILSAIGRGDQIYVCQNAEGVYAWKLKAPDALLLNAKGDVVGRHFAGPTWEWSDGSRVIGKVLASVPSPGGQAISWLLLAAASHEGTGLMTRVLTIQRIDTQAGMAPAIPCGESNKDETVLVPYQARYNFFALP